MNAPKVQRLSNLNRSIGCYSRIVYAWIWLVQTYGQRNIIKSVRIFYMEQGFKYFILNSTKGVKNLKSPLQNLELAECIFPIISKFNNFMSGQFTNKPNYLIKYFNDYKWKNRLKVFTCTYFTFHNLFIIKKKNFLQKKIILFGTPPIT